MEHNDDIQSDIFSLALMFIIAVYLIIILPVQLINKHKTQQELLQAKEIAIYYYDRSSMLEHTRDSLNTYIDEQDLIIEKQNALLSEKDKISRILKDLSLDTQKKIK
jgi:hypothetical protein